MHCTLRIIFNFNLYPLLKSLAICGIYLFLWPKIIGGEIESSYLNVPCLCMPKKLRLWTGNIIRGEEIHSGLCVCKTSKVNHTREEPGTLQVVVEFKVDANAK